MDKYGLAHAVVADFLCNPEILDIPVSDAHVKAVFEDPYWLLASLGHSRPNGFDLLLIDFPRASKRRKVQLPTWDASGNLIWTDVAHDDPDYLIRLTANSIAVTRLAANCLARDGVILAVATPETYVPVRTSIEQLFGHTGFLGELVYQTRSGGANDSKYMDIGHETLLVFTRDPSKVSGFQIRKEPEELRKYSSEDDRGRYYWDTYIRKQARNYYKIECPDGTFLEEDEFGNRISWLWTRETFLRKLAEGEVKFEENSGNWRLYYKARLREFKILRSLVLNNTELVEVSPEASGSATGKSLLTQRGSEEIKEFSGPKPEYLKSSEYFRFVLDVFGRGKRVLLPFSEYGAAIYAESDGSGVTQELVTNNKREHEKLVRWRLKQVPGTTAGQVALFRQLEKIDLTTARFDDPRTLNLLQNCVFNADESASEWFEVDSGSYQLLISEGDCLNILIRALSPDSHKTSVHVLDDLRSLEFNVSLPVTIWAAYNRDVIRASFPDLTEFKLMSFPQFLL